MKIVVLNQPAAGAGAAEKRTRGFHLARTLAREIPSASVTLAFAGDLGAGRETEGFLTRGWSGDDLPAIVAAHDVVISSRIPSRLALQNPDKRFVFDCYAPAFTEWRELTERLPRRERRPLMDIKQRELSLSMAIADLTLCANEPLRDLAVGMFQSIGLISTRGYDSDTSLRTIVDVAPFGVAPISPAASRPAHPGIGPNDLLMVWNAPLTPPYEPEAALAALHRLTPDHPNLKLIVLPLRSWNLGVTPREFGVPDPADRVRARALELGVLDRVVFVDGMHASDGDIEAFMAEADLGVCAYADCVETRYAGGAHYMELLAAGLPVICTAGDPMSAIVERHRLGLTVPGGDPDALAGAIARLAAEPEFRSECRARAERYQPGMSWEHTLRPLIDFCREDRPPTVTRRERMMPIATQLLRYATSRARYGARAVFGM